MNQNQIHQLTSHLSQALDQNYDVVNMEAVLSVIFALEGTTITKEQLEATRLAKYINQLRRRTKNEQLARRAKSLLKKWREMVGIQQTTNDSNSQVQLISNPPLKPITRRESCTSESNLAEGVANTSQYSLLQPSLSSPQQDISDLNTNLDFSEVYASGRQAQHKNFSSIINHLAIENSLETNNTRPITKHQTQKSDRYKNDHTTTAMPANEKLMPTDASVVIDIVSDSDENESGVQTILQKNEKASSSTQPLPAIYPRPKKLKKERKRREKNSRFKEGSLQQQCRNNYSTTNLNSIPINDAKTLQNYPTEILSSNSSMSSIISGDALSGSTQIKHSTTTDLTFAGKFKSVLNYNADNSLVLNVQKNFCRFTQPEPTNLEQPLAKVYDDYIVHNDSSTSCSRLSLFEEVESKQIQKQIHSKSNSALTTSSNNIEYNMEVNHGQCPKKRGRKKGSKGVDSKIAKESSLSQQILFGSGVKKVKTTKELFKDIQSRKLGISLKQGASSNKIGSATIQTFPNRNSSFTKRPISPCSDTSMHSQTLKMYSSMTGTDQFINTLDDAENTDSETITSELSRDSIKFDGIIRKTSLDSNSNSLQTLSAKNIEPTTVKIQKDNDLKTQLLHLVNRMKIPLSVNDTEQLYQAEIVPCTCIIIEETPNLSTGQNNLSQFENEDDSVSMPNVVDQLVQDPVEKKHNDKPNTKISIFKAEEVSVSMPQKAMKSIFDLDFDDDDPNDSLRSIIKNVSATENMSTRATDNDNKSSNPTDTLSEINNVDIPTTTSDNNENHEESNIVEEPSSMYIVQEDPNCIARKIFNIQSNDVTNFHVNALHNYYVPNINGNWNSIDTSLVLNCKLEEFLNTLDSYTVSDGVDVVPKYGSLTYERIRKDLSCLKFGNSSKPKTLKSFMQPFLGIAKCLPSCRLAAKRQREEEKQKQLNQDQMTNSSTDNELFKHSLNSLTVDIDSGEDDNKEKMQYSSYKETISEVSIEDNTNLSYNLLQLVNNSNEEAGLNCKQNIQIDEEDLNLKESRCSSTSSLGSINEKIEDQGYQPETAERSFVERNRKKRRKTSKYNSNKDDLNAKHCIKRIKIAINGDITTERQLPQMGSSNQSSDDDLVGSSEAHSVVSDSEADHGYIETCQTTSDECEKESIKSQSTTNDGIVGNEDAYLEHDFNNDNNEYAIVQRPVLSGGNNHIVLTIKKTPSKIHSPVNLIPTTLSSAPLKPETAQNIHLISNKKDSNKNSNVQYCEAENVANENLSLESNLLLTCKANILDLEKQSIMLHTCPKNFQRCRRYRRSYSQKLITQTRKNPNFRTRLMTKLHKKLFFKNELYREDNMGRRERIFNYSSSSDYENESIMDEEPDETEQLSIVKFTNPTIPNVDGIHNEETDISFASEEESMELQGGESNEYTEYTTNEIYLPNHNNNMLPTFNSIFDDHSKRIKNIDDKDAGSLQALQVTNSADVNSSVYYNYNNLIEVKSYGPESPPDFQNDNVINDNIVKINANNCNSYQTPCEYRTGVRTVLDSRSNISDVNSFSRVQQFKEWHEVLQIQSYNDEPLTVLPYVVLE